MKIAMPDSMDVIKQQAVYWFLIFEDAAKNGDHTSAADAQSELARMGIRVSLARYTDATEEDAAPSEAKAVRA